MSRQQYTLEFKDEAIRQVTEKGHSSLDYRSPLEFELKKGGVLGGSAPEPPFMNEGRREQEGPGLTV